RHLACGSRREEVGIGASQYQHRTTNGVPYRPQVGRRGCVAKRYRNAWIVGKAEAAPRTLRDTGSCQMVPLRIRERAKGRRDLAYVGVRFGKRCEGRVEPQVIANACQCRGLDLRSRVVSHTDRT